MNLEEIATNPLSIAHCLSLLPNQRLIKAAIAKAHKQERKRVETERNDEREQACGLLPHQTTSFIKERVSELEETVRLWTGSTQQITLCSSQISARLSPERLEKARLLVSDLMQVEITWKIWQLLYGE